MVHMHDGKEGEGRNDDTDQRGSKDLETKDMMRQSP